ncbi:Carbon monoxide dehydrogenase CooS subunit (EC [Olavius algarvensis associated proteobacterium Delta 3]|nr:Carbon monoxide dehydrogenase CooS subunit (EC [Olavius algarvensis associated proteobacterium Delta 3]
MMGVNDMTPKRERKTITEDGLLLLDKMEKDRVTTVWDRFQDQLPNCGYCEMGLSCRNCVMGPCRVDPFGEGPQVGVCGADANIIVARNLGRMIAAGAASHSDHGRDLVDVLAQVGEGNNAGYQIRDPNKLKQVAGEFGVDVGGKDDLTIASELAYQMQEDYGMRRKSLTLLARAPEKRRELWMSLGVVPRGIDRETSEMMHRTHMGVDNDWKSLLLHGIRNALSDGWGGSMIASDVSDILFGTPTPHPTKVNAGVLEEDQVNIVVHGHNPVVSEMVLHACHSPDLLARAEENGATGINLVGVCCTGNELLMRHGIAMAGNHLSTELILATGAVDMMIVDYQCIMPSISSVAACYNTKMISTSDKAKFPGMDHREFHPHNAKAGFKVADAISFAGPGLKEICGALGIPPVLHFGSCVDNVRILVLASALANALDVDISDLPIAGAAPEWYSEKAATIGVYFVASGVYTVLGPMPPITGSMDIVKLLTEDLESVVGATFAVEPDPENAAILIRKRIESKRAALGLDARDG